MRFVIVTGMSGAGKSSVLKMLEDAGYFCVDNLPIQLIKKMAELTTHETENIKKVALGVDIRSGESLAELDETLVAMESLEIAYEILYLDAETEVLVKRYKETRRTHPLAGTGRVDKGIELEREKLEFLKEKADVIIDTSRLLIRELKEQIVKIYVNDENFSNFVITILSFGFKYGIPSDSDLVFDVRFLPNPFYIPELKHQTGNDKAVRDYVMEAKEAGEFLKKLEDLITFLVPNYIKEGKNQLVISIGCTGGKHRSVTLANALTEYMKQFDYGIKVEHRDITRDVY